MATHWGVSWGVAWGHSWDIVAPPPATTVGGKWRWKEGYDAIRPENHVHKQPLFDTRQRYNSTVDLSKVKKAASVMSSLGGNARAASLTATQRSNIASNAAKARWK